MTDVAWSPKTVEDVAMRVLAKWGQIEFRRGAFGWVAFEPDRSTWTMSHRLVQECTMYDWLYDQITGELSRASALRPCAPQPDGRCRTDLPPRPTFTDWLLDATDLEWLFARVA